MSRHLTKKRILAILELNERVKEQVSEVFTDYCEIFKIHVAYGVEDFNIGHQILRIRQDITRRGCHDTETHELPVEWLYLPQDERRAAMLIVKEQQDAKKRVKDAKEKQQKLAYLEAEATKLRNEIIG